MVKIETELVNVKQYPFSKVSKSQFSIAATFKAKIRKALAFFGSTSNAPENGEAKTCSHRAKAKTKETSWTALWLMSSINGRNGNNMKRNNYTTNGHLRTLFKWSAMKRAMGNMTESTIGSFEDNLLLVLTKCWQMWEYGEVCHDWQCKICWRQKSDFGPSPKHYKRHHI